jgi:uncharacterized protein YjdB
MARLEIQRCASRDHRPKPASGGHPNQAYCYTPDVLPPGVSIEYQVHRQDFGWENPVFDGQTAGAEGSGKRIEAIKIRINGDQSGNGVIYQAHVQDVGWQEFVSTLAIAGTVGQSRRMEAIKIAPVLNPARIAPYG